jgi:cytochrome c556
MQSAIILLATLSLSLITSVASAGHATGSQPTPAATYTIKQKMSELSGMYLRNLRTMNKAGRIDFQAIQSDIGHMQETIREIQHISRDADIRKRLKKLSRDMSGLQQYTQRQDILSLRRRFDQLFTNCFQCHTTHRP